MGFIENLRKLKYIHHLINLKKSGTAYEIALKVGLSKRAVFNYIDLLRDLGAMIKYDASLKSYVYSNDFVLDLEKL